MLCIVESRSRLWRVQFFVVTCASLIPSHLLEFRYFITPFLFIMAHLQTSKGRSHSWTNGVSDLVEISGYCVVDVALCYVFVYRPFVWNDGSMARFMW